MSNALAATAGSPIGVPTDPVSFPAGTSTSPSVPVLTPALTITKAEMDEALNILDAALTHVAKPSAKG